MQVKIEFEEHIKGSFFNRLANPKPLMKELSLKALSAIQKNIEGGIKPDNAPLTKAVKQGNNTLRDSGRLRASLTARHSDTEAVVGTNVPYAHFHNPEDGRTETVIRPKNAKFLCLPAGPETRKLFRKYGWSPREVIAALEAKGFAVYRPYKRCGGERSNVIMAKEKGKEPFAVFVLKKSIKIPVRPFMFLPDSVIAALERRVSDFYAS